MHETSHYRQFSKTDRTVTSARQTRNDDHNEHERIRRRRVMRSRKSRTKAFFRSMRRRLIITLIDHHEFSRSSLSRLLYNTFDHCRMSLSRARVEHEIKTSKSEKNSKSSIWENMIVLKSFDKKTWSFWSLHKSFDDTNATEQIQIRNETIKTNMRSIKTNVRRLRMTITVENRLRRFRARNDQKNRLRRFDVLIDHHFLAFIVHRWHEKSL
jgi:hypothetical protein